MRIDARSAAIPLRPTPAPRPLRPTRSEETVRSAGANAAGTRSGASATRVVKAENRAAAIDPAAAQELADQVSALMAGRPPLDMRM